MNPGRDHAQIALTGYRGKHLVGVGKNPTADALQNAALLLLLLVVDHCDSHDSQAVLAMALQEIRVVDFPES